MEKNMKENFENMKGRVFDSLCDTDLERINYELAKIDDATLISGVGGSSVVSAYASRILNEKNGVITRSVEPRDFNYLNLSGYKNVLACSYSGNNYGVTLTLLNNLKHYLLASKENDTDGITNLTYCCKDSEKSFISLAATLIPCSILLNYYLDNDQEKIMDNIHSYDYSFDAICSTYEIFSGLETSSASKFLESTMVESGIGVPIVHDKYSYCHGRSTLSTTSNNIAIYFNLNNDLDKLLISELPKYYKDVILIDTDNSCLSEHTLLVRCMYLVKHIAEKQYKDLSGVDYNPIVKKLYKYNGKL